MNFIKEQSSDSSFSLAISSVAGILLIAGALVFLPLQSLAFTLPKLPFYGLAGFLGLLSARRHPGRNALSILLTTWTGRLCLLTIVWILLSPLWSIAPLLSIVGAPPRYLGALAYAVAFAFALTGIVCVQEERTRRILTNSITLAAALVSLYGGLQIVHLDPFAEAWQSDLFLGRVFSTIGQPNQLGQFLLLTLPFMALAMADASRLRRTALVVFFVLGIAVLISTGSRAALIGCIVSMGAVFIGMGQSSRRRVFRHPVALALVVAAFAAVAVFTFINRFTVPTQDAFGMGTRPILWEAGIRIISDRSWGYGLETVGLVSSQFLSPALYEYESLTTTIDRLHSLPLDLWATVGPVALLAFAGFLLLLLFHLWRNQHEHPLLLACFCSLLGVHVALLVGFADITTLVFLWLVAGMALGSLPRPLADENVRRQTVLIHALLLLTFVTSLVSSFWLVVRLQPEPAAFPIDRQLLIESAETALLVLEKRTDVGTKHLQGRMVADSLDWLDILANKQDGMVPTMRAWLAATEDNVAAISAFEEEAIRLRPTDVTAYRILAHVYELTGDAGGEARMIEEIRKLLPPAWRDAASPRGQILRKETPWLEPLLQKISRGQ